MFVDVLLVAFFMIALRLILKIKETGKLFLQGALIYTIVILLLRLTGSRGDDLITMIKSRESYHDKEIKKLF